MATEKKMHENSLANLKPFTKTYRPKKKKHRQEALPAQEIYQRQ